MRKTRNVAACALLASAAGVATLVWAEPLDPPAGPVEPTGATQILEIPFTIDEPGSYRLARDVVASGGIDGVTIEADNVTLDLGGHSLDGGGMNAGEGIEGVRLDGNLTNVTIRNGRIANWDNAGIWNSNSPDFDVVIEDVTITNTDLGGLEFFGSQTTVRNVVVRNAEGAGIGVGENSLIADCRVDDCGAPGVAVGRNSTIRDSIVSSTSGVGGGGLTAEKNCVIENTVVAESEGAGVIAGPGAVVRGSVASNNGIAPANAQASMPLNPRTAEPIYPDFAWSAVTDRKGNQRIGMPGAAGTEGFGPDGFQLARGSLIVNSVARNNADDGIAVAQRSRVENCTANDNEGNGVHIGAFTTVSKCTIQQNAGDGVAVEGEDNRIDSNTIGSNDSGIVLNDNFNRVVRNDLSLDLIVDNDGGNNLPPENDYNNPWSNFTD